MGRCKKIKRSTNIITVRAIAKQLSQKSPALNGGGFFVVKNGKYP